MIIGVHAFLREADAEMVAAKQNLKQALDAWEARSAQLQTEFMILKAAHTRMEKAQALVRSAMANVNTEQQKVRIEREAAR